VTSRLRLVVNPVAGSGRALRLLPAVTAALDAAGAAYEVIESASLSNARELDAEGARLGHAVVAVVAVGGDGTVGALAGQVAGAGGTLAIMPADRGNDFARVLGIPTVPAAAAAVLTGGGHGRST
jgi:diacylglycerol kinase family enzyme